MLNENRNKANTNVKGVVARPIKERQREFSTNATVRGTLVSNLDTSHPDKGSPIKELMGMVRRMVPSSASFRCKASLMVGIRDAQLEKLKPERKKYMLSEIRC
jgi:hypothetical protein